MGQKESGGTPSTVESRSTVRPSQEKLIDTMANLIEPRIGEGATPFPGETFAQQGPEFQQAIDRFMGASGDIDIDALMNQLSTPSYVHDPARVAEQFQTGFADPLLETFGRKAVPFIKEQFAGDLFSTRTGDVIAEKTSEFVGDVISPNLLAAQQFSEQLGFQAAESAKTGALTAAGIPFAQLQQEIAATTLVQTEAQKVLSDAYNRFLKLAPEQDPWIQLGAQIAGLQSVENIGLQGMQGQQGTDWAALGGMLGAGALAGGAGAAKLTFLCIPEGTVIDCADGQKPVEAVRAGDVVYDKDNQLVIVKWKYEFDEEPTEDRFIELTFETGVKVTVCDLHKIGGIRAKDLVIGDKGLVFKEFVPMAVRSYDLLTSSQDGSYRSNGIGIDSMIPELHERIKNTILEMV